MQPDSVADRSRNPRVAPSPRQIKMRHIASGQVSLAWPVDARDRMKAGGWEIVGDEAHKIVGPGAQTALVPEPPPTPPTHIDLLGAKSYKELQVLAKRAGLNAGQKKDDIIAALLPLVEARVVSLEEITPMAPDPAPPFAIVQE